MGKTGVREKAIIDWGPQIQFIGIKGQMEISSSAADSPAKRVKICNICVYSDKILYVF